MIYMHGVSIDKLDVIQIYIVEHMTYYIDEAIKYDEK